MRHQPPQKSITLARPPALQELLKEGQVGLFLDFDGTLVELASEPDGILVPGDLGERLDALADRLDGALALVSGRSIDNLGSFATPRRTYLAGSHGGEIIAPDGTVLTAAKALPEEVHRKLAGFAGSLGLLHERKTHGGALHYRSKPQFESEASDFAEHLARAHGLATKHGKCVVELVRPGADKGGAVALLAAQPNFTGRQPIFVGDDITDEDGFAACNQLGGFGIQIGTRAPTVARYRLPCVEDLYQWLNL